jgi:aarF domain-containing kinase
MNPALKTQYVKFWMAMINGDDEELAKLCSEWGIHDSELFANMTLMRRRKRKPKATPSVVPSTTIVKGMSTSGKYENEEGEDRRHGAVSDVSSDMSSEERAKRSAERQMRLKERVKHLLKDTSEFPHELGFVNRSVNYIRATNWAHGSPIDRVALFADAAARADVGDEGRVGQWSVASEMSVVGMRLHLLLELWGLNWWGLGKPKSSDRATASTTVGVGTTAVPQASSLWR